LESLIEGLDIEESSGFDPSGSSGLDLRHTFTGEGGSESGQSVPGWSSNTDDTSLSQGMSALDLEGMDSLNPHGGVEGAGGQSGLIDKNYNAQLEGLDIQTKEAILIETFPGLKMFDVKWTLKKCNGNAGQAIDELLHQVFLEETGSRPRGIEGFSETDLTNRSRKGKGKKNRPRKTSEMQNSEDTPPSPGREESKWENARRDIDFLTSKTGMPAKQVSSMYHSNGASIPATINAIIDAQVSLNMEAIDPMIEINAQDLSAEFPSIPIQRAIALVELTHPSTAAAHELAKALTSRSSRMQTPIQIEFRLAPPDLSDGLSSKSKPQSHNAVFTTPAPFSAQDPDYLTLRHNAFTQARNAHRAAKSNPLMGGAASYYSQLGRDYSSRHYAQTSAQADQLVASQSSSNVLDLHGVNVKDAVRIAREGVTAWWAGNRGLEPGIGSVGYKIITGKGTHSEGGKSRLGPAVGGMLIKEGWRVQAGGGAVLVTGVIRKK
jgi:hypothetical protein